MGALQQRTQAGVFFFLFYFLPVLPVDSHEDRKSVV